MTNRVVVVEAAAGWRQQLGEDSSLVETSVEAAAAVVVETTAAVVMEGAAAVVVETAVGEATTTWGR